MTKTTTQIIQIPYPKLLQSLLKEIRLLRSELPMFFPQEDLKDYANPRRIKQSYQKSVKKHRPYLWK